ncbi:MAG: (Fe-S)-binding protein [Chloroflexota bacterium]
MPGRTRSAFDGHHPPDPELIADCVHCGFCLPTCPTYALWGEEMDSPRGRIYLMKLASEGQIELNETVVPHIDRCLGCMACVTACPSGVQYDKLIESTRAQVERHVPRSRSDRLFRRMLFELFPYPKRMRAALLGVALSERLGLRSLLRGTGLLDILSGRLDAMETVLPRLNVERLKPVRLPSVLRPYGPSRRRVGLIAGCVQRVLFGDVNAATARTLLAEGCEVVIPTEQGCCGALELHAGEEERTLTRARELIALFERARVETIVINAAGCGSTLKEYGYLLRDEPFWAARARAFSEKVRDISELLFELEPRATYHPLRYRVAYHDACHLRHAQGVYAQPRVVLGRIPELELLEIAESEICCGSAGIYNLVQPEAARELGDRKAANVGATGADAVATSNPGCLLQISSSLDRCGRSLPTLHPIELLDASIRGVTPKALQGMLKPATEPRP